MGAWCTKSVTGPNGVNLWKSIRREWLTFSQFLQFDVCDGTRVKFWHDIWCGDCPLKVVFPELFSVSCVKDFLVAKVLHLSNGVPHWDVRLSRPVQDWELESLLTLMDLIYSKVVRGEGMHRLCRRPTKSRIFEV